MRSDIEVFIVTNEPAFVVDGKEYSVCCPAAGSFSTWDSDGNMHDYDGIDSLLDNWVVGGKPFRQIVQTLM